MEMRLCGGPGTNADWSGATWTPDVQRTNHRRADIVRRLDGALQPGGRPREHVLLCGKLVPGGVESIAVLRSYAGSLGPILQSLPLQLRQLCRHTIARVLHGRDGAAYGRGCRAVFHCTGRVSGR